MSQWTEIWNPIDNAFCPTGDGGGIDPTCSIGKGVDAATARRAKKAQLAIEKWKASQSPTGQVAKADGKKPLEKVQLKEPDEGDTKDNPVTLKTETQNPLEADVKWRKSLTGEERSALTKWTSNEWQSLRSTIASLDSDKLSDTDKEQVSQAKTLLGAVKRAPKIQGTVYRGLKVTEKDTQLLTSIEKAGEGGVWVDNSIMSMSRNPGIAAHIAAYDGVMMRVKVKTGRGIENTSEHIEEKEVIGMPKTKYRISKIARDKWIKTIDGVFKYKMLLDLEEI